MTEYLVDRLDVDGDTFNSSNIDILGYDRKSETLFVEFHSSGTVYSYSGVKESTYDMLVNADSVGSFYARHIKGTYDGDIVGTGIIELHQYANDGGATDYVAGGGEQGDVRWASGTPDFATGPASPSRYEVWWTSEEFIIAGPFKPEYEAVSEADAISQHAEAMANSFGKDMTFKVVAVVHYFD